MASDATRCGRAARARRLAPCVFLLLSAGSRAPAAEPPLTVLRCARLFDARSGELLAPAVIQVRGDRIAAVGTSLPDPPGAMRIDLGRETCLPGLMDLHAHILYSPGADPLSDYLTRSSARRALDGLRAAQAMLRAGFTTLRDPGDQDPLYASVEVRNAIARGEFLGPRLFVAPHYFSATGGHGDLNMLAPDAVRYAPGKIVDGPEALRAAVREEIKYGADWIKLFASGGVMSAGDDPRGQDYSDEELRAAVEEAHRHGRKVTVHAIGPEAIKASIRAGVDSVEHAILIDDEGIALMKERGTWLVPTLYVLNYIIDEGPRLGYPAESIAKARALVEERDRRLRAAFAAGVRVAFGSDTIFPHEHAAREFAHLVRLGLSPAAAIRAATLSSAQLLGIEEQAGSLDQGKIADIVAVPGDPLANVRALEAVSFVMKSGRIVKQP
jgi:imidazolonepropionase-like amidohydrolase